MYEQTTSIEGTTDFDVASALAYLSGFAGCRPYSRTPSRPARREIIIYHPDSVAKDPDLYLATIGPDIIVTNTKENEYVVEYNERVDPQNIERIEDELRRRGLV
jgi:hypothetical protein